MTLRCSTARKACRSSCWPVVSMARAHRGTGRPRAPALLGVKAVIAGSYERIHRSNLVGMGILPLQYQPGDSAASLGLTGRESFSILGLEAGLTPRQTVAVVARDEQGEERRFTRRGPARRADRCRVLPRRRDPARRPAPPGGRPLSATDGRRGATPDGRLLWDRLREAVGRAVVGGDDALRLIAIALLADGHVLLEDVPGTGKTLLARAIARALGLSTARVQGTPDLLPGDVTGSSLFEGGTLRFVEARSSRTSCSSTRSTARRPGPKPRCSRRCRSARSRSRA